MAVSWQAAACTFPEDAEFPWAARLRPTPPTGISRERRKAILTHTGLHVVLLIALPLVVCCAGLVTMCEHHVKGSNIHDFGQGLW